jgi:mannose-6-phosphate isomerase-like protein (cupin superfamily)
MRLTALLLAFLALPALAVERNPAEAILDAYAQAWRGAQAMPMDAPLVLSIAVSGEGGGEFSVHLPPDGPGRVEPGAPAEFTLGYETDIDFLRRLDRGEINALTAMGQARGSDPTPMRLKLPEGVRFTPATRDLLLPLTFHFWNREWPPRIPFGEAHARFVHGGNAVVFFYQGGVRSAWYQIKPGMHVNREPGDQSNPFQSLLVVIRGAIAARLDGNETLLTEGEAVFIPAGMRHEFWAEGEQSGEAILVMFGAGA